MLTDYWVSQTVNNFSVDFKTVEGSIKLDFIFKLLSLKKLLKTEPIDYLIKKGSK